MPATEKQVRYFDYFSHFGPGWYRSHFPSRASVAARSEALGVRVVTGEFSPSYMSHPFAPERAAELIPDARLVAVLRNPVDRAYSHWQHCVRTGRDDVTEFERALELEESRLAGEYERMRDRPREFPHAFGNYSYALRGRYAEQLQRWLQLFPREQLLVVQSEHLRANPREVLATEVCPYLGIESHVDEIEVEPQLVGGYEATMSTGTRARLRDYFEPYNSELRALLGQDFDWE